LPADHDRISHLALTLSLALAGQQGFHAFDVLQEMTRQFPAGAQVVQISSGTANVYSLAGQAEGRMSLMVTLTGVESARVTLSGLPDGKYSLIQYTEKAGTRQKSTCWMDLRGNCP